jgi:hypothetical protein
LGGGSEDKEKSCRINPSGSISDCLWTEKNLEELEKCSTSQDFDSWRKKSRDLGENCSSWRK